MSLTTMYDAVNLANIPKDAEAVAGYVNGRWKTYPKLLVGWPDARKVSIAVTAEADAECLDVEPHDARNDQAAAWVRRQQARGVNRPIVYTSVSNAKALLETLALAGVTRRDIRLWTAHYTHVPHRCGPACGYGMPVVADATQYTDRALDKSLDASLCSTAFLHPQPPPAVRRATLRDWIVARRSEGWTWARLKATANWREWRRLGGR